MKWNNTIGCFVLSLPDPLRPSRSYFSNFHDELLSTFDSDEDQSTAEDNADKFVTVINPSKTSAPPSQVLGKSFPVLDQLPRPEVLFTEKPLYHIIVDVSHSDIVIRGSHQPSLELIANYFKKWSRKMENDVRKVSLDLRAKDCCSSFVFVRITFWRLCFTDRSMST